MRNRGCKDLYFFASTKTNFVQLRSLNNTDFVQLRCLKTDIFVLTQV